jgi:tetratricopeptide (TPR) repeat protein
MRGPAADPRSAELLVRALCAELPEIDPARIAAAVQRAAAHAAAAQLDTEGFRVLDLQLARVEATEEAGERAAILRDLADHLAVRGDASRALVVRLAAFSEAPSAADLDPLLGLARQTDRIAELPLESMLALIDVTADASVSQLTAIARAWQDLGHAFYAADCLERVLAIAPLDPYANESLELLYRTQREWAVLADLLGRRANHVASDRERGELLRELGVIYERELADPGAALDAFREAERLAPGHRDALDAIARLASAAAESSPEALTEALSALERLGRAEPTPAGRARVWCRAAAVAKLADWDHAQHLLERARAEDPDVPEPVEGLAALRRDRGDLPGAVALLIEAAGRPALVAERARWLADAADLCVATGDTDRAKSLYRGAREADPASHRAGVALVELCWDTGSLLELAPILDELCRSTTDPDRLRGYLLQRGRVARELGDLTGAGAALARAVELAPEDVAARRELAALLVAGAQWDRARPLLEGLLDGEDALAPTEAAELHYHLARCTAELGDRAAADRHAASALALAPAHREALLLRAELDDADPHAHAASQLALAALAPPAEAAARLAALGERYLALGDRGTARELYREALQRRPGDHLLLTRFLDLVAEDGDWSYSLDLVQRLIDTERDPIVRGRYRHVAAQIARDELDAPDRAAALLAASIEDDPRAFTVADELEALLAQAADREALARFYYQRLEHVRNDEGRPGERLRLWDLLGEVCLQLGRTGDAVLALEVAASLAPAEPARRERLADLAATDPARASDAIAHHQAVLRSRKDRVASYRALAALYAAAGQPQRARAAREALAVLVERVGPAPADGGASDVASLFAGPLDGAGAPPAPRALREQDWIALSHLDVDLQLSALFALVAPAFAAERARLRPPPGAPARTADVPAPLRELLERVAGAFGLRCPPLHLDPERLAPCTVAMRVRGDALAPVILAGRPAIDAQVDPRELAFLLARQLADLRSDRIARLLCPRGGELAQIIELAMALPGHPDPGPPAAARWLAAALHPLERDRVSAIGARLREAGTHPLRAALDWLEATARAADRIGFVVAGDLASCCRALAGEVASLEPARDRVVELVWASVTDEVFAARARVEGWAPT